MHPKIRFGFNSILKQRRKFLMMPENELDELADIFFNCTIILMKITIVKAVMLKVNDKDFIESLNPIRDKLNTKYESI